ncbi:YncE family protein [Candidatus Protofrankia californiensis]|uniref:YVTN family beta-propeller repeat protein n=2 Tax=Frankiaceae TaxID=74712 RepID=UPI0010419299
MWTYDDARLPRALRLVVIVALWAAVVAACGEGAGSSGPVSPPTKASGSPGGPPASPSVSAEGSGGAQPVNVYAFAGANQLSPAVRGAKELVYVPNSDSNTVDVIDPATFKVIDHFVTGRAPQHVVPAWDLSTLYVTNNLGNSLTPIDPTTGKIKGPNIPVADPYNMYFAPDGKYAIVVAEELQRLDFYDPHTWQLRTQVKVDCPGVDHVDFSADNSFFVATCEFSGKLVKVDLRTPSVVGYLTVEGMPQDIKLDPRGEVLYIADMMANGLHLVDPVRFQKIGFLATGKGAHGLYPNREATAMYVSNRGEGSVSVVDFTTRQVQRKWQIPGGGSPDMGGVSADGSVLWLTGRYNSEVYAISTKDGSLLARIKVGPGPHGACVWPQPGRYSLGHTGILR